MERRRHGWWDGPWPTLAYLAFYVLPWLGRSPTWAQVGLSVAGLAIFLPAYFLSYRLRGLALVATSITMLLVGVSLAPVGGGWTVFPIYAGVAALRLRPYRRAAMLIVGITAATAASGLSLHQPILWWLSGVFLLVMTGSAGLSREMLDDRTEALLASQEEVRRLAGTAERERLQRDLHDVIGRTLTLVALKADLAERLADRDLAAATIEMRAVAAEARAGLAEVRAALSGRAGSSLASEAVSSIEALKSAGVKPYVSGDPASLEPGVGGVFAMTLREAVTNVVRHASARTCSISLSSGVDGACLEIADDGAGGGIEEGNGIRGMRQRLTAAGGSFRIESGISGTRLTAFLPA